MSEKPGFDDLPIGFEMGPVEWTLDDATVNESMELVQWAARDMVESRKIAPPGISIVQHPRMKFNALPHLKASIWAKSEHEFIRPMKVGMKIIIRGKVIEKYSKRGHDYVVTEYETVDEGGAVLMGPACSPVIGIKENAFEWHGFPVRPVKMIHIGFCFSGSKRFVFDQFIFNYAASRRSPSLITVTPS